MEIIGVQTSRQDRYILVHGLTGVAAVLHAFALKEANLGSSLPYTHNGITNTTFYGQTIIRMQGPTGHFIDHCIIDPAQRALQNGLSWEDKFDFDGEGPFLSTSITIQRVIGQRDLYILGLWRSKQEDRPERELAAYLNTQRTLVRAGVEVTTCPVDRAIFEFDFDNILHRLGRVMDIDYGSGSELLGMLTWNGENRPLVTFYERGGIKASLTLSNVADRLFTRQRQRVDTWQIEDAILRGPLLKSYETPDKRPLPTLRITLRSAHDHHEQSIITPIWVEEEKEHVLKLQEKLCKAFSPQP